MPSAQNLAPRTLLVTGGCGFIGSNFIRHVLRKHPNWIVINLDKLTYAGNLANLTDIEQQYGLSAAPQHLGPRAQELSPRYLFVRGSICNREIVDSLLSGSHFSSNPLIPNPESLIPDSIVNFAAESHVDRSILDAAPFVETNIKGTQVLLEAARSYWRGVSDQPSAISRQQPAPSTQHPGSGAQRHPAPSTQDLGPGSSYRLPTTDYRPVFIQISTDEVYGALGITGIFTEDSPLLPNSPYAASKAAAELLCRAYHKAYGLPVVITRSSNNYGPYQFPEKLIPLMIRNALTGKPLPVYGEGKQVRDWLYVEDNCAAIDLVLQKGEPGEAYNIGGSCEKTNIDVVHMLCDILEQAVRGSSLIPNPESFNPRVQFIPDPRGSAHDFRYGLDSAKITKDLDWKPQMKFEQGLKRTVDWYLENREWVESVITGEYQVYYGKVYGSSRKGGNGLEGET